MVVRLEFRLNELETIVIDLEDLSYELLEANIRVEDASTRLHRSINLRHRKSEQNLSQQKLRERQERAEESAVSSRKNFRTARERGSNRRRRIIPKNSDRRIYRVKINQAYKSKRDEIYSLDLAEIKKRYQKIKQEKLMLENLYLYTTSKDFEVSEILPDDREYKQFDYVRQQEIKLDLDNIYQKSSLEKQSIIREDRDEYEERKTPDTIEGILNHYEDR